MHIRESCHCYLDVGDSLAAVSLLPVPHRHDMLIGLVHSHQILTTILQPTNHWYMSPDVEIYNYAEAQSKVTKIRIKNNCKNYVGRFTQHSYHQEPLMHWMHKYQSNYTC